MPKSFILPTCGPLEPKLSERVQNEPAGSGIHTLNGSQCAPIEPHCYYYCSLGFRHGEMTKELSVTTSLFKLGLHSYTWRTVSGRIMQGLFKVLLIWF